MPLAISEMCTQFGITEVIVVLFFRKIISVVTLSASLNVPEGSLTAPKRSQRSARYFLALSFFLSIVNFEVTMATIPPGFTLSTAFAAK